MYYSRCHLDYDLEGPASEDQILLATCSVGPDNQPLKVGACLVEADFRSYQAGPFSSSEAVEKFDQELAFVDAFPYEALSSDPGYEAEGVRIG